VIDEQKDEVKEGSRGLGKLKVAKKKDAQE